MTKNKKFSEILKNYEDIDFQDKDEIYMFRFEDEKGNFDYNAYKKRQIEVSQEKFNSTINRPWVNLVADHILKNIPDLKFGMCHGTRAGHEQKFFASRINQQMKDKTKVKVLGTEINPASKDIPNTIVWDFHKTKKEWINNLCFIYSNSLDHSYDPISCLSSWMSCIKPNGKIYLQRAPDDDPSHVTKASIYDPNVTTTVGLSVAPPADIFRSSDEALKKIVQIAGKEKWKISSNYITLPSKEFKKVVILEKI